MTIPHSVPFTNKSCYSNHLSKALLTEFLFINFEYSYLPTSFFSRESSLSAISLLGKLWSALLRVKIYWNKIYKIYARTYIRLLSKNIQEEQGLITRKGVKSGLQSIGFNFVYVSASFQNFLKEPKAVKINKKTF